MFNRWAQPTVHTNIWSVARGIACNTLASSKAALTACVHQQQGMDCTCPQMPTSCPWATDSLIPCSVGSLFLPSRLILEPTELAMLFTEAVGSLFSAEIFF